MQHGTLLRTATYTRTGAYSFVIVMKGMLHLLGSSNLEKIECNIRNSNFNTFSLSKPVLKTAYVRMQKYKRNYQYFRYPKRNLHFFFLIVTFLFLCTGNVDILINIKTEQLIVK